MNLIFMGTPEFAAYTLKELIKRHTVIAVICQPDKPNKRGRKTTFSPVKRLALENGLELLQPEYVRDEKFIEKIRSYNPDIIVVSAYGKILPAAILKIPRYGCVNVHASLLPKYRGAAPVQWAIINGDLDTGVTIMYMGEGLDTGDMIKKRHVVIEPSDTYGSLIEKLANVGTSELLLALDEIASGSVKRIIQNDAEATYAPVINKETGHIDWNNTGISIVNLIRALNPVPGAYCDFSGNKLKIWEAEVYEKNEADSDIGKVVDVLPKRGIVVNTADSQVLLTELQLGGGKKMKAAEFLKGHKVEKGTILG